MKYINNLAIRILVAVAIGLLFASVGTKITYTCTSSAGELGCVSYEKAVMHPGDLANNKQDSLAQFSKTFAIASLTGFALLSVIILAQKKKPRP